MTTSTPSSYAFDNAMVEGRRRLALLESILDPGTFRRLERIDVKPGWRCLELGAGGGSVTEWLCNRVDPDGHVTAVDLDARFIRALEFKNLEVLEENVLPQIVAAAGLAVLSAEADWEWFRGGSPVAEFWKISWTRVRDAVEAAGGDVTQWDRELAALDDPTILSVHPATISVIATK